MGRQEGVLRDGRPNSATLIHTILNKDSVRTNAIDRIIGGQLAPTSSTSSWSRSLPSPQSRPTQARVLPLPGERRRLAAPRDREPVWPMPAVVPAFR